MPAGCFGVVVVAPNVVGIVACAGGVIDAAALVVACLAAFAAFAAFSCAIGSGCCSIRCPVSCTG